MSSEKTIVKNYDGLWAIPVTAVAVVLCLWGMRGCEANHKQNMAYIQQGYSKIGYDLWMKLGTVEQARTTP